jgi:hypothetical protein
VRTGLRSMGRDYVLTWEITEHEAPRRQTIESTSGPFPTTLAYRLSARDGGTLVELRSRGARPECSVWSSRSSGATSIYRRFDGVRVRAAAGLTPLRRQ